MTNIAKACLIAGVLVAAIGAGGWVRSQSDRAANDRNRVKVSRDVGQLRIPLLPKQLAMAAHNYDEDEGHEEQGCLPFVARIPAGCINLAAINSHKPPRC